MHHRKTVDEYRDIVAIIVSSTVSSTNHILVNDLKPVVMDVDFVN